MSIRRAPREPLRASGDATGPSPLVIAHRGASLDIAEHTLAAYERALSTGADGLECDVRLTSDGHLVCVHDRRVDRTSDGHGVVSELNLAELDALDFSSWHDASPHIELSTQAWPRVDDQRARNEPYLHGVAPDRVDGGGVLTLEALLELVADAGRPVWLLIETKHPTRYAGLVEKQLVRTLHRFGMIPGDRPESEPTGVKVAVMSFAPLALRRVRLLAPSLPTVLLIERILPLRRRGDLPHGTELVGPGLSALWADPGFVARAHDHGHRVFVWTVDSPSDLRFVLSIGVDAIISNDLAAALRARSAWWARSGGAQPEKNV